MLVAYFQQAFICHDPNIFLITFRLDASQHNPDNELRVCHN